MKPFNDVYGVARSGIALATLLTLAANTNLFPLGTVLLDGETPAFGWSLFVLFGGHWGRFLGVGLLALVVSGWRPRFTGVLHLWVAASLTHSPGILDGGEHVAQAMALLMLPLSLLDGRRWHWSAAPDTSEPTRVAGRVFLFGLQLQVCLIYLEAFVAKFEVAEWRNGTALYYWAADPLVGSGPVVQSLLAPVLSNALLLPLVTWSVLALEFFLAACIIAGPRVRRVVLPVALMFHAGIAFMHGISSFALIMMSCLLLYLRFDKPLGVAQWGLIRRCRLLGIRAMDICSDVKSLGTAWLPGRDKRRAASGAGA